MKFTIDFVRGRLTAMRTTPQMWAFTKEAFVVKIVTMLEMIEVPTHELFSRLIFGSLNTVAATGLDEKVEDSWAQHVVDQAYKLLEKDITMKDENKQGQSKLFDDEIINELTHFLQYSGDDVILQKIAELAELLGPSMNKSFSGTTAGRKLLECKEAYLRSTRSDEIVRNRVSGQQQQSSTIWVRTTIVDKDHDKQEDTER